MPRYPIGISDFRNLRERGYLFVDTSELVGEVVREDAQILLLTRPRRFGKTLNLSMLAHFFDIRLQSRSLFEGLKVTSDELALQQMNSLPTVFFSFKDVKVSSWEMAWMKILTRLADVYAQFEPLLPSVKQNPRQWKVFESILDRNPLVADAQDALMNLVAYLHQQYHKPVLLLIDEYDVPIQSAWSQGYYEQMIDFMRVFLSAALKDNPHVYKGILTGITRVAKESIFSGLNNLKVFSVLHEKYASYFGFTQEEVDWVVEQAQVPDPQGTKQQLRKWYNGYSFGSQTLYNPWSVLNSLADNKFQPYWINTSSNDLIIQLV
ncbi:MAG TPA: AAA family ATPase, partial [Thermotogota bacterium]|nr:AAA family ATPase [Thermotogota bacterium]